MKEEKEPGWFDRNGPEVGLVGTWIFETVAITALAFFSLNGLHFHLTALAYIAIWLALNLLAMLLIKPVRNKDRFRDNYLLTFRFSRNQ